MSVPVILSPLTGDAARARRTDPETSHAAADSISSEDREASELEVLAILRGADRPLTTEQMEARHAHRAWQGEAPKAWTGSRIRTAVSQLAADGYVVQDGEGKTKSGRRAAAWRLATEGEKR
jgi:hypothetical protein